MVRFSLGLPSTTFTLTYEFDDLGHFDLGEDTTRNVFGERRCVANGECVRPFDSDLSWFTAVELSHALDLGEGDKIAIFKSMSRFVEASDQAFGVLFTKSATQRVYLKMSSFTFDIETVIPSRTCSPVGSTQVNLGPKSLKAELIELWLRSNQRCDRKSACLRKETMRARRNEVYTVGVGPVIDLELELEGLISQHYHLVESTSATTALIL